MRGGGLCKISCLRTCDTFCIASASKTLHQPFVLESLLRQVTLQVYAPKGGPLISDISKHMLSMAHTLNSAVIFPPSLYWLKDGVDCLCA